MKVSVISFDNKKGADIEVNADIFGQELRKDVLFRVVEWQRSKKQSGNHKVKERGEVTCTTKKPFRQKGTGNARQGSNAGPHMRGGGVAMGPKVRSHAHSLPKSIRKLGLKVALSYKLAQGELIVLSSAELKEPKTAALAKQLTAIGATKSKTLLIDSVINDNVKKASSNLVGVNVLPTNGANVLDILKHDNIVLTVDAIKNLEERLA